MADEILRRLLLSDALAASDLPLVRACKQHGTEEAYAALRESAALNPALQEWARKNGVELDRELRRPRTPLQEILDDVRESKLVGNEEIALIDKLRRQPDEESGDALLKLLKANPAFAAWAFTKGGWTTMRVFEEDLQEALGSVDCTKDNNESFEGSPLQEVLHAIQKSKTLQKSDIALLKTLHAKPGHEAHDALVAALKQNEAFEEWVWESEAWKKPKHLYYELAELVVECVGDREFTAESSESSESVSLELSAEEEDLATWSEERTKRWRKVSKEIEETEKHLRALKRRKREIEVKTF